MTVLQFVAWLVLAEVAGGCFGIFFAYRHAWKTVQKERERAQMFKRIAHGANYGMHPKNWFNDPQLCDCTPCRQKRGEK